ncbi:hypothetical protein, conserved [Eimeria necatrix]|uniref:Uncharacterized protein n=1 Tax=Eimeria necatrix TaxID=51315 RepID=U6MX90_9EIME|nr:hypothetical protein, conserved [Eimeria necatrix]CDJ67104.1 hypothetical protein, conserved [Eimeria necatrix]
MSSVPSFLRSGAVPRPSNKAADLATLRSSWARLLLAARGGKNTPRTLALSPQTESSVLGSSSSNSSSRNTASSNTVTSNSLSDTSRDASQDTRLFQTEDERLCAEAETCSPETDAADEEQQQQQDAAAAAKAVTVGVSPVSQTCVQNREVLRSGGSLPVLQSGALAGVPSSPESGTCGSPRSLLSAGLTVACLSPRQGRRPSGDAAVAVEDLDACVRLSPAPWAAEEGLEFFSTETLPAPLLPTLPALPGSSSSNSGKSPLSPTSLLFSSSDPRRYIGPLVKSAVISIESLPASMVLPALSKSSSGLDAEFPLGITQQHKAAALLQLHLLPVGMRNMASDSSLKLRQQQSRQPMSCPELQVVQTASSAKKLLSGLVSRTSWRTKEAVSLLTQRKMSGALYALCRCQPPSRPCSRSSLTHGPSKQGAPLFTEEPLQCAAPPVEGCNSQEATPVAGQCRRNMQRLTEKHGSIAACAIMTEQEGCVRPGLGKLRQEMPLGSCFPETVLDIRRLLLSSFQEPTLTIASAPMGGAAEMQKYGNAHIRERLGRYWGLAESRVGFNPPGLDWRTRNVYETAECIVSQPLKLGVGRGISGTGENLCEPSPPLATPQIDLPFRSLVRVAGIPLRPSEEGGNDLMDTEQPSVNVLAFAEIDAGDSLDVLRSHAEAQESLAAQRQLNLADVTAAGASLSGSGVAASGLQVYAKSIQCACSSTMQRALKAAREMTTLQATDEGIVSLRRFQEELMRFSTELESTKLPPEQCPGAKSSRPSSPGELSMGVVVKIEKLAAMSGSRLPVPNIILGSVPEFLLLNDLSCASRYGTSLRCMAGTIRDARRLTARKFTGCISAPFEGGSCASLNSGHCFAMAARFERTQNALKEIARNVQLVAPLLIEGAFTMFNQNTGNGAEASSLKLLQDQHTAATAGGAQVPLDKLMLEQKEALKHLPLELVCHDARHPLPIHRH